MQSDHDATARAPGWLPDERAFAGRENLDAAHVARYDAKEDAGAAGEVALLRELGLGAQSLVLDFGTGTGQFALAAAPFCERVIAIDVSEPMLERLEAKLEPLRLQNVELVQGGLLSYEHAGRPADFVYSRLVLHHLPDFWKAFALNRLRTMLDPGGLLRLYDVVYDFDPAVAAERIEAWCASGGESRDADWTRAELEEHVRDEHSTFSWLLEPIIERSGFRIRQVEHSRDGIFAKYLLAPA